MSPRAAVLVAAPLASGVLLWLASPSVGLWALGWVALVPAGALALARPETRAGRAALPLAFGIALELELVPALPFGLADDQWGEPPVPILVAGSPVLVVALVLVPAATLLLYALRFPQPLPLGRPRSAGVALASVVVAATAWTALDVVRTHLDPGGFWGPLFLSQAGAPPARLAALGGPWLLTFALVASGLALAALLVARPRRVALAPLALAAALAVATLLVDTEPGGDTVRVAAVQPGYDTAEFDLRVNRYLRSVSRDLERASLDLLADLAPLTREAAADGAEIVLWPEATLWVDPHENGSVRAALAGLAEETGALIVAPYFLRSDSAGAAVAALPDGTLAPARRKQRPMWYLGEQAAEAPAGPLEAGEPALGALLGVDMQAPGPARRLTDAGAELLLSSTHDWEALARRQRALARLFAVALGAPLVRADWRHGSAIVAADGSLAADAGLEKRRTALVGEIRVRDGATPYARIGDAFGWACLAAAFALFLAAPFLRRRASAG